MILSDRIIPYQQRHRLYFGFRIFLLLQKAVRFAIGHTRNKLRNAAETHLKILFLLSRKR